jgi:hypothetical protein
VNPRRLTPTAALVVALTAGAWASSLIAADSSTRPDRGSGPQRAADTAAVAVVRAFYTFHFAHDMGFSAAAVRRRAAWLAPDLLALCRAYFAKPSNPDEVPSIDSDPFTDSQDYPRTFRVGAPTARRSAAPAPDTALVPVTLLWSGTERRTLTVVLVAARGAWLIADVRYPEGPSLRRLLLAGP